MKTLAVETSYLLELLLRVSSISLWFYAILSMASHWTHQTAALLTTLKQLIQQWQTARHGRPHPTVCRSEYSIYLLSQIIQFYPITCTHVTSRSKLSAAPSDRSALHVHIVHRDVQLKCTLHTSARTQANIWICTFWLASVGNFPCSVFWLSYLRIRFHHMCP